MRPARAGIAVLALVAAVSGAVGVLAPGAGATPVRRAGADTTRSGRVLLFSLPHVTWADLQTYDLPNLRRLLASSGVAALTTRTEQRATHLADGYLTLGAGTRAVGDPSTDGDNLGVNERFGRDTAGQVFTQRTGRTVDHGIVALTAPRILDKNDGLLYDAEIGAFPVALRDAGYHRAVIANADGTQPDSPPSPTDSTYRRQAALAMMGPLGAVPNGRVDDGLLMSDPAAPYGVRLDQTAVEQAFERAWQPHSVVLVEASDLVRADAYRPYATPVHRDVMFRRALFESDRLLGRLLHHVDLHKDSVVVFGPAHSARAIALTVLGVHAPGMEPGLLRSATTRRSGFVQMIDVAPTVLHLLGIERPTSMEGRPAEIGKTGGSADDRVDLFVNAKIGRASCRERV